MCDIATGLAYLHQQGIVHGDMKAGNVLVDSSGSARIADYGMRRFKGRSQSLAASEILRLRHMSPECLMASESVPPTKASDTYAFGMTIYEVRISVKRKPLADLGWPLADPEWTGTVLQNAGVSPAHTGNLRRATPYDRAHGIAYRTIL